MTTQREFLDTEERNECTMVHRINCETFEVEAGICSAPEITSAFLYYGCFMLPRLHACPLNGTVISPTLSYVWPSQGLTYCVINALGTTFWTKRLAKGQKICETANLQTVLNVLNTNGI